MPKYIALQQSLPFTVLKLNCRLMQICGRQMVELQQSLPFTVLKPHYDFCELYGCPKVATVLTVYGIETVRVNHSNHFNFLVATVLTVYGIETTTGS